MCIIDTSLIFRNLEIPQCSSTHTSRDLCSAYKISREQNIKVPIVLIQERRRAIPFFFEEKGSLNCFVREQKKGFVTSKKINLICHSYT